VSLLGSVLLLASDTVTGRVIDPQDKPVAGASVILLPADSLQSATPIRTTTDHLGAYRFETVRPGGYKLVVEAQGFIPVDRTVTIATKQVVLEDFKLGDILRHNESIVIAEKTLEPAVDMRNATVFERSLFTRDDQVFQQLNAGINAGQHEGGGKSLEIRRFGFNLDHGGVNGGLKVLLMISNRIKGLRATDKAIWVH